MSIEDKAQEHEAEQWERNNAVRPGKTNFAPGEPGYGPAECDECADEMPAVRRTYGYRLCVACKTLQEQGRL